MFSWERLWFPSVGIVSRLSLFARSYKFRVQSLAKGEMYPTVSFSVRVSMILFVPRVSFVYDLI